jgi:hypothetical protein
MAPVAIFRRPSGQQHSCGTARASLDLLLVPANATGRRLSYAHRAVQLSEWGARGVHAVVVPDLAGERWWHPLPMHTFSAFWL